MKKYFLVIFFLLICVHSFGKKQVVVALSLNDCSNCYNTISQLKRLDGDISIQFLLQESYKSDSADIRKLYAQSLPKMSFVFNDQAYDQFIGEMGQSSLHLIQDKKVLGSYHLKTEVNAGLVDNFNRYGDDVDTLNYAYNFNSFSVNYIQFVNNKIIISKHKENKVSILDRFNPLLQSEIEIDDSLIKVGYNKYFGHEKISQEMFDFFKSLDYHQIATIYSTELLDGIVYVGLSIKDLQITPNNADTFEVGFQCIYTFDTYGNFLNCALVKDVFNERDARYKYHFFNEFRDTFFFSSLVTDIIPQKNSLLLKCMKVDPQNMMKDNYFIARFELDSALDYVFKEYLPFNTPEFYIQYPFNRFTIYSSNDHQYFTTQMSHELYRTDDLSTLSTSIPVDNRKLKNLYSANDLIFDLQINNGIAYYIITHSERDVTEYVMVDIKRNTVLKSIELPYIHLKNLGNLARIDPLDESYILQLVDNKTFIRKKMN